MDPLKAETMKILVGSQNPVKIEATEEAFSTYFGRVGVVGVKVDSGVPKQPIDDETFQGARNRAFELKRINDEKGLNAKFFVGIEGGITRLFSRWFAFGEMCIVDDRERVSYGKTPFFELPEKIVEKLLSGAELGEVMDRFTGMQNTKRKQGAVGYFTKGVMNRKQFYVNGLLMALIPFINGDIYFEE